MRINSLEKEMHKDHSNRPIPVFNDNESSIANINRGDYEPSNRHVGVRYHWIRDMIRLGEAIVSYLASDEMPADGLTKGLDRIKHTFFLVSLGLG
jgi:hypothetical protein